MKQWALTVCVSCLLAGMLEMLLPKTQSGKSIKTVLALYILLSVLSGGQTAPLEFSVPKIEAAAADYSGYADRLALEASGQGLEEKLHAAGVEGTVSVSSEAGVPQVKCVSQNPERAREILLPLLGPAAELECVQGETKNEQ